MVKIAYTKKFQKIVSKIKDRNFRDQVNTQIKKIIENPDIGKPMKYERKGTRELYVGSFRISYGYFIHENKIVFVNLYHKDEQ